MDEKQSKIFSPIESILTLCCICFLLILPPPLLLIPPFLISFFVLESGFPGKQIFTKILKSHNFQIRSWLTFTTVNIYTLRLTDKERQKDRKEETCVIWQNFWCILGRRVCSMVKYNEPPTRLADLNDPLVQTMVQWSFDTGDPGEALTLGIQRLSHLGSLDTLVSLS